MKILKQSTYESCLACCLLMIIDQDNQDEIEIWKHGWNFNYLIGQLNYVSKKYDCKLEVFVENIYYFNQLNRQKEGGIKLENQEIDAKLLSHILETGKAIVYLDHYYLDGVVHSPHFVVAMSEVEDKIEIADPGDGEIKMVPKDTIIKAINSLRSYMLYSPVLIKILG